MVWRVPFEYTLKALEWVHIANRKVNRLPNESLRLDGAGRSYQTTFCR